MILDRVDIKNFRSISYLTLSFSSKCLVLVGINESGKSNIIKALSTLSDDVLLQPQDIRQTLPDEAVIKESFVRFVFKLSSDDLGAVESLIANKILFSTKNKDVFINKHNKRLTLRTYIKSEKSEILYIANLMTKSKYAINWNRQSTYVLTNDFKGVSQQCPDSFQIQLNNGTNESLKNFILVHKDYHDNIPKEYLVDFTYEKFEIEVNKITKEYFLDKAPDSLCWDYSEKNLLPSQIDINQFIANPDICIPLKQMFIMSGITDIKKTIETEKTASTHRLRNCLNRVAENTTRHFRDVWKEYKDISIQLSVNGNFIEASVKDDFNHYEFSSRSDGFKRFITFLLLISAKVKTNNLTDTLILIDEPDICLHPSGARYLRDELINISNKNNVVYSTHSIFMIDKENIERHLIVKKTKEITSVSIVTSSNIVDEEVLFNALGYSIFESLKTFNIIFEGWKDKKLFEVSINKLPKEYKQLKDKFKNVGLCHAKGVKDIQNVVPMLQLADRKCLILSDNDKTAIEKQKEFKKTRGYGLWLKYKDIDDSINAITGEDFLNNRYIHGCFVQLTKVHPELLPLTTIELPDHAKLSVIQRTLKNSGISEENAKQHVDIIKDYLFDNIKASDIDNVYYEMLLKLAEKVEDL